MQQRWQQCLFVHAICQASTFEFTYDARDFAEEWTKGTENAVQYKDIIHMYVYTLTHLHLVSVGLTQVHPNDYNYT